VAGSVQEAKEEGRRARSGPRHLKEAAEHHGGHLL